MAGEKTTIPVPPGIDMAELRRTLGDLARDLKTLRAEFDDFTRREHNGVDDQARTDIAALAVRVGLLETFQATAQITLDDHESRIDTLETAAGSDDSRLDTLEAWKTGTVDPALASLDSRLDAYDALTIGSRLTALEAHTHSYSQITGTHGNEDHSSTFVTISHVHPYSDITGTHDSSDHSDSYASSGHNHNTAYSDISHNHSGVYANASHGHSYTDISGTHGDDDHSLDYATQTALDDTNGVIDTTVLPGLSAVAGYPFHTHDTLIAVDTASGLQVVGTTGPFD